MGHPIEALTPDASADRGTVTDRCWWAESETEFRARLAALFPGFSHEQIIAGLTVPACEETTP